MERRIRTELTAEDVYTAFLWNNFCWLLPKARVVLGLTQLFAGQELNYVVDQTGKIHYPGDLPIAPAKLKAKLAYTKEELKRLIRHIAWNYGDRERDSGRESEALLRKFSRKFQMSAKVIVNEIWASASVMNWLAAYFQTSWKYQPSPRSSVADSLAELVKIDPNWSRPVPAWCQPEEHSALICSWYRGKPSRS